MAASDAHTTLKEYIYKSHYPVMLCRCRAPEILGVPGSRVEPINVFCLTHSPPLQLSRGYEVVWLNRAHRFDSQLRKNDGSDPKRREWSAKTTVKIPKSAPSK